MSPPHRASTGSTLPSSSSTRGPGGRSCRPQAFACLAHPASEQGTHKTLGTYAQGSCLVQEKLGLRGRGKGRRRQPCRATHLNHPAAPWVLGEEDRLAGAGLDAPAPSWAALDLPRLPLHTPLTLPVALERNAEPLGSADISAPLEPALILRPGLAVLSVLAVPGLRDFAPSPASFALALALSTRARVLRMPVLAVPISRVRARSIAVVLVPTLRPPLILKALLPLAARLLRAVKSGLPPAPLHGALVTAFAGRAVAGAARPVPMAVAATAAATAAAAAIPGWGSTSSSGVGPSLPPGRGQLVAIRVAAVAASRGLPWGGLAVLGKSRACQPNV